MDRPTVQQILDRYDGALASDAMVERVQDELRRWGYSGRVVVQEGNLLVYENLDQSEIGNSNPIPNTSLEDLENRFAFHPADEAKAAKHEAVRRACLDCAEFIQGVAPAGRETALAVTKLEEAMMWANAAIARNDIDSIYPEMEDGN